LFHFQEHGTRADLPDQRAEVSYKRPQSPDPGASAQPLYALLFLHLRPSTWTDRDAGGFILAIPGHLLPQWPLLHRARNSFGARSPSARTIMRFWLSTTWQHCKLPPIGLAHRSFKSSWTIGR